MNELDLWVYFDGPEPENVRFLLDAARDALPALSDEERAVAVDQIVAALGGGGEASAGQEGAGASAEVGAPGEAVVVERAWCVVEEVAEAEAAAPVVAAVAMVEEEVVEAAGAAALAETRMTLDLPREEWEKRGILPFKPRPADAPKAARTLQVPVMRTGLGETAPVGDDSIARARDALPFLGNTMGKGEVPFPRMTVEQYASLCVELAFWPDQSAATLERYRVLHEAARKALDAHWRGVFAARAEERAAFDAATQAYAAYLRAGRR